MKLHLERAAADLVSKPRRRVSMGTKMPPPPTPPTVPHADPRNPIKVANASLQLAFSSCTNNIYKYIQRSCNHQYKIYIYIYEQTLEIIKSIIRSISLYRERDATYGPNMVVGLGCVERRRKVMGRRRERRLGEEEKGGGESSSRESGEKVGHECSCGDRHG